MSLHFRARTDLFGQGSFLHRRRVSELNSFALLIIYFNLTCSLISDIKIAVIEN